jgi:hypothetical protein
MGAMRRFRPFGDKQEIRRVRIPELSLRTEGSARAGGLPQGRVIR